jgi:hypothetical protein
MSVLFTPAVNCSKPLYACSVILGDASALTTSSVLVHHTSADNHDPDVASTNLVRESIFTFGKETYRTPAIIMKIPGTQEAPVSQLTYIISVCCKVARTVVAHL